MGIDITRLLDLPDFPEDSSGTAAGTYTVTPDFEEHSLVGEGPEYKYQTWFQTPPLDPETIKRIHSVQLFAESHAQGFVDNAAAGTWTWFELAIMENEEADKPRVKDGVTLAWTSHKNFLKQFEYGWKSGVKFGEKHDIFRLLEDGNVIAVRLCARFLEWVVYAKSGFLQIEIGNKVKRKPLEYGQVVTTVKTVNDVFREINSAMALDGMQIAKVPEALFTAGMMTGRDQRPLRVLSLDGGGVRGIAALMLLDEVMKRSHPGKLPHEVFDMIGGTSTGGFIAVMLGRMKMSIADCITCYTKFMNVVFPPKNKVIKDLIQERLGDPDKVLLMDSDPAAQGSCKVFLMAVNQSGANNHAPVTLRSYEHPLERPAVPGIKLWEACRATSAAPSFFEPLKVGGFTFLDGGLQANNPLGWHVLNIPYVFGPTRNTSCFLSIGTGTPRTETVPNANAVNIVGFAKSMASIATNTEITNILFRSLINAFAPHPTEKKYWRFNVGDGCPDFVETAEGTWEWKLLETREEQELGELDDVAAMKNTITATEKYMKLEGAEVMINECAKSLAAVVCQH
ncbi:acyl transferase/acyl hydrolase/lysophospholipase [Bombardia bombarda]|uniref:Acyl transferase/acyl hydrolase/lysophospholipase n=1 Tax=Bombardia bombarda TaxID=252184 RepID=A0AA39U150_9PEZI|nr:acyl transferase/acyl hydrolase/lysophospholipase [Bombardia bombarda]